MSRVRNSVNDQSCESLSITCWAGSVASNTRLSLSLWLWNFWVLRRKPREFVEWEIWSDIWTCYNCEDVFLPFGNRVSSFGSLVSWVIIRKSLIALTSAMRSLSVGFVLQRSCEHIFMLYPYIRILCHIWRDYEHSINIWRLWSRFGLL